MHVRVDIASNGTQNAILLAPTGTWSTNIATAVALDITEYNGTFGANSSVTPVFVDANDMPVAFEAA